MKKTYTTYICKNCGGAYHESCARRLMEKDGLSFLDGTYVKCCENNEFTNTTGEKPEIDIENKLEDSESQNLMMENVKMKCENKMLQTEIQNLKYILKEYKESRERLMNEMNDKNMILKENNQLLIGRIAQLQKDAEKRETEKINIT